MSKFIVAIDVGTREQRNAITIMFQSKGWQLWHWMEDVWLLALVPDNVSAHQISEEMAQNPLIGQKTRVVIKLPESVPSTYWGHCAKDAWEWMARFWGGPG